MRKSGRAVPLCTLRENKVGLVSSRSKDEGFNVPAIGMVAPQPHRADRSARAARLCPTCLLLVLHSPPEPSPPPSFGQSAAHCTRSCLQGAKVAAHRVL